MKEKPLKPPKEAEEDEDTPQLTNLYCTQDIGRTLYSQTLAELASHGLNEDVVVSYVRIVLYLLMSCIGTYSAIFTSVEKGRNKLAVALAAFAVVFCTMLIYERFTLRGASFRLHVNDKLKVYLWCNVNWRQGTYDIDYAYEGKLGDVSTYSVPLGETFFEDGKMDEQWYRSSMAQLCKDIKAMHKHKAT